jgi:hypothetical protein
MQRYVSDELTHFVGRALPDYEQQYDLLVKILTSGWLIAPGTEDEKGQPRENATRRSYHWGQKLSDAEGLFRLGRHPKPASRRHLKTGQ